MASALMVWIDQDLCTGDGICSEICPDVFVSRDDGLWVVKEEASHFGETIVVDGADGPGHGHDLSDSARRRHHECVSGADTNAGRIIQDLVHSMENRCLSSKTIFINSCSF